VTAVNPASGAARAGLRRGDLIIEADHRPVRRVPEVRGALRDGAALLRIRRGEGTFYAVLSERPEPSPTDGGARRAD
jgi:S1-C subfamily serine protease